MGDYFRGAFGDYDALLMTYAEVHNSRAECWRFSGDVNGAVITRGHGTSLIIVAAASDHKGRDNSCPILSAVLLAAKECGYKAAAFSTEHKGLNRLLKPLCFEFQAVINGQSIYAREL
jgi:hypothetical protein